MTEIKAVFGYGSLVNSATHGYHTTHHATLAGWRRVWVQAAHRPVAFLSIERADTKITGLLAQVGDLDWADLDAREHAYLRRDVNHQITHQGPALHAVAYEANPAHTAPPSTGHPILLSYLDVVVQGHLAQFGPKAADEFADTTAGWGPVLDDRADPVYPRHQRLSERDRDTVDGLLRALSVSVWQPEQAGLSLAAIREAATRAHAQDTQSHADGDE